MSAITPINAGRQTNERRALPCFSETREKGRKIHCGAKLHFAPQLLSLFPIPVYPRLFPFSGSCTQNTKSFPPEPCGLPLPFFSIPSASSRVGSGNLFDGVLRNGEPVLVLKTEQKIRFCSQHPAQQNNFLIVQLENAALVTGIRLLFHPQPPCDFRLCQPRRFSRALQPLSHFFTYLHLITIYNILCFNFSHLILYHKMVYFS